MPIAMLLEAIVTRKKAIAEGSNVTTGALSSACFTVVSVYMGAWEIMEKKSR